MVKMIKMTKQADVQDDAIIVKSELIVKASNSLQSIIEDELLVEDPLLEKAVASLKENEVKN
jgi:hypothetical protein